MSTPRLSAPAARPRTDGSAARWARRGAVVLAVALAWLAGGGVAWAFWSTAGRAQDPPSVTAGRLDLVLGAQGQFVVGPGGTYDLAELDLTGAMPGTQQAQDFTVGNGGSARAPMTYTVAATVSNPAAVEAVVRYGGTDAGTTCSGGTTTPSGTVLWPVAPGQTGGRERVCVEVRVRPTAPSSFQGQAATVTVVVTARQVAP